jgi:hypothetical protein
MKKVLALALLAMFSMAVFGAIAVTADDGMKTIDAPADKWPAKKLKDGAKKKPPVTFNHGKHGADNGCVLCHHTQDDAKMKDGSETAVSCFTCHGPEAKDKQVDTYKMIHDKKIGKCVKCHKDGGAGPTKCGDCHKK